MHRSLAKQQESPRSKADWLAHPVKRLAVFGTVAAMTAAGFAVAASPAHATPLSCVVAPHTAGLAECVPPAETADQTIGASGIAGGGGSSLIPTRATAGAENGDPPLAVTAISPPSGSSAGGTDVTIAGTGFNLGSTARVGGVSCAPATVVNDTTLTCTTAAHSPGATDVTVITNEGESATLPNAFTYTAPAPAPTRRCQLTVSGVRSSSRRLPVNKKVTLVARMLAPSQCLLQIATRTPRGLTVRGDVRPAVTVKVNKKTGKVTAVVRRRGAKVKVSAQAIPIAAPFTKASPTWTRTWKS